MERPFGPLFGARSSASVFSRAPFRYMVRVTELAPLEQAPFRIIQGIEIIGLIHECIRSSKSPFLCPMGIYSYSCQELAISMPNPFNFFWNIISVTYNQMPSGGLSEPHFFSREVTIIAVSALNLHFSSFNNFPLAPTLFVLLVPTL